MFQIWGPSPDRTSILRSSVVSDLLWISVLRPLLVLSFMSIFSQTSWLEISYKSQFFYPCLVLSSDSPSSFWVSHSMRILVPFFHIIPSHRSTQFTLTTSPYFSWLLTDDLHRCPSHNHWYRFGHLTRSVWQLQLRSYLTVLVRLLVTPLYLALRIFISIEIGTFNRRSFDRFLW